MADPIKISVHVGQQPVHVRVEEQNIQVGVNEERIHIESPFAFAQWPFGPNPKKCGPIASEVPTVVDQIKMPGRFQLVKWLILITDVENGLGVSSELNAFSAGGQINFTEYAWQGDTDALPYDFEFVVNGADVQMMFTSHYAGEVEVNTMKIGMFS